MKTKQRIVGVLLCGVLAISLMACREKAPKKEETNKYSTELAKTLSSEDTMFALADVDFTIPFPQHPDLTTMQGGYSDGTYYYQTFIKRHNDSNEKENIVHIVKYDIATGQVVKESGDLKINHSNDITYNSKLNVLVIANNNPRRNIVTFVDPEELTVIKEIDIRCKIFSIDYNETTDRYVVGVAGGQSYCILDSDFNMISDIYEPTDRTVGYTTQGVSSDDDFIYFVLYNQNVVTVYDWDGNFITLIETDLPSSIEPENISVVGKDIYIGCANPREGLQVFKITDIAPVGEF